MKKELIDYINRIYILKHLIRYNNTSHIKNESVIEHLGFVTLITYKLHDYYDFNLEKALVMSITHDLTEIEITDIPHNVKRNYPELKNAIKSSEERAWSKVGGEKLKIINEEFNNESSVEGLIVQLADVLSCIQYSQSEMTLGNKGYMAVVYKESIERLKDLEIKLKKHLK